MRKLTRIVAPALVAVAMLGTAGAASAQPYGGPGYGNRGDWGHHQTPARAEAIRD